MTKSNLPRPPKCGAVVTGRDLRKMRMSAGKTTSDMAMFAGVKTRKTYENWEQNISGPKINQFVAMCEGCGKSPITMLSFFMAQNVSGESNGRVL